VGVFKQLKEMKEREIDDRSSIEQAQRMVANARAATTAYPDLVQAVLACSPTAVTGPEFEPIGAVSLEIFAQISKSLATIYFDLSQTLRLASDQGVSEESWAAAVDGWNARMAANPAVGARYSALYAAS